MARSLAFWIGDVDDNLPRAKVELHFNLWTLRSKKINYLDIGVLFEGLPSNGTINFISLLIQEQRHTIQIWGKRFVLTRN